MAYLTQLQHLVPLQGVVRALIFLSGLPLLAVLLWIIRRDRRLDNVPGPKGSLITGIGRDLPPNAIQKFREWADEYGEVYKIRLGWYTWVVLNSPEAVKEILDKQVSERGQPTPIR